MSNEDDALILKVAVGIMATLLLMVVLYLMKKGAIVDIFTMARVENDSMEVEL